VTCALSDPVLVLVGGLSLTLCGLSGGATLGRCSTCGLASPGLAPAAPTALPAVPLAPVPVLALAAAVAPAGPLGVTVECLLATGGGGFFDGISLDVLHTLTYIYIITRSNYC